MGTYLKEREQELGLRYFIDLDEDMLSRCFFEMDGAVDEWARGKGENVLFVDATFNTNAAGLSLVAFVTVGSTGQTVVLAIGLLLGQDYQSYEWLFRRFHDVFKVKPVSIFTDSAPELDVAIRECSTIDSDVWFGIVHNLCIFHLSQNVFDNCRKAFGPEQTKDWRELLDVFWRLAKQSDERGRETFQSDFQTMTDIVLNALTAAGHDNCEEHPTLKWLLTTLYDRREKWAACFTWSTCSWGAHSTQRSESWNRGTKLDVNKHTMVTDLCKVLDKKNKVARDDRIVHDIRARIRLSSSMPNDVAAYLLPVVNKLTPYAVDLLKAQLAQSTHYASGKDALNDNFADDDNDIYQLTRLQPATANVNRPTTNEDGTFRSWQSDEDFGLTDSSTLPDRVTSRLQCSCQYPKVYQLPCRHMLALWQRHQVTQRQALVYPIEQIGSKWIVLSAQEQVQRTHQLRTTCVDRPIYATTGDVSKPFFISPAARYPLLMAEFRSVAQLGALNMKNVDYVRDALEQLIRELSKSPASETTTANSGPAAPKAKAKPSGNDEISLMERLGTTMEAIPIHDAIPIIEKGLEDDMVVLIKYANKRSGEWVSGLVQTQDGEPQPVSITGLSHGAQLMSNYDIVYDGEESNYDSVYLGFENYTTEAQAARWYWMLLRDRPAGASEAQIASMTLPRNKPTGSSKRKKPAAERANRRRK